MFVTGMKEKRKFSVENSAVALLQRKLTDTVKMMMNIYSMSWRLTLFHLCVCSKGNKRPRKRMKINKKMREFSLAVRKKPSLSERERETREERKFSRCINTRYLLILCSQFQHSNYCNRNDIVEEDYCSDSPALISSRIRKYVPLQRWWFSQMNEF